MACNTSSNIHQEALKVYRQHYGLFYSPQHSWGIRSFHLKNEEDVADVIQGTILSAYEHIGELKTVSYFKTWLIRILINHCTDVVRQQKRVVSMEQAEEQTGTFLESDYEFYELIRELPEKDRTIFLLYYGECFNAREIAELLGWNENTVKSRLQRGRKKLKQVLSC